MKPVTIVVAVIILYSNIQAQTKHDLDRIDSAYNACIRAAQDSETSAEEWWPDCWDRFTKSLDSLEEVAFNRLVSVAPLICQDSLRSEELKWHKKRDAYYRKEDQSHDDELVPYKKTEYVENHILYLFDQIRVRRKQKR